MPLTCRHALEWTTIHGARVAGLDRRTGSLAVGKEAGRIVIYDSETGNPVEELHFPAPLLAARFAKQGKLLVALTSKQEAITLSMK